MTAQTPTQAGASQPLLAVRDLSLRFGGVTALDSVSFDVAPDSICGIIGPNGAGKTSLFNCLSRIYEPSEGTIRFAGADITRMPAHRVGSAGIARTFQNVALFDRLSVRKNVEAGCFGDFGGRYLSSIFMTRAAREDRRRVSRRVDELMAQTRLADLADEIVADLPFGTRKRVELARALAMSPRLLLLDEPACGLNHEEVVELASWIREVRDAMRVSVLLIEHHMNLVMRVSDQVVVLEFGKKIADGTPELVASDEAVICAYLGSGS
ncbi:high-affinity branched-chain amino acid ABC transporter ATP-binding protein LivG [Pigmentiphaga sp. NML080357]|uniref:ABC transporter ATP-binding protein n=1 Tax=Pigmentiphaga sp. NML080357 TaxID=2008675 RepID=UPI000B40AF68|nr:ABC transporter ATP-binding protein [Pigmentiphaga sp. NML080357]OVZ55078.1 high-affinity branched-chain amino acid ABC transporter ATP-binding protein LivG [Pigmentiphaga sp. NML080357]